MKKIRTFIVGSSLLLFAWLAASYTHELDQTDVNTDANIAANTDANTAAVESATASVPAAGIPATEPTKDQLTTTASLTDAN